MADLLTHVLVAFSVFTVTCWWLPHLDRRFVPIGMVGACLPALNRVELVVASDVMSAWLGHSFSWGGLHTLLGIPLLCLSVTVWFDEPTDRRRGLAALLGGAGTHLLVELPQRSADGRMFTNLYLFPVTDWRPPTPGWYVSGDLWMLGLAVGLAACVYGIDQYRQTD